MAEYVVVDKDQLESDLTIVADAIREKGGTSEQLAFPNGMKEAVEAIQSGGNEEDILSYANNIAYLFYRATFPNDYTLKVPLRTNNAEKSYCLRYSFNGVVAKKIVLEGYVSNIAIDLANTFQNVKVKEVDLENFECTIATLDSTFRYSNLETIRGELDLSVCTSANYTFQSCYSLRDITFKPNTIKISISFAQSQSLSDASIQSIIDGLADLTGQTAQTVTFHADVKAKLTDEQKAQITSKNWISA